MRIYNKLPVSDLDLGIEAEDVPLEFRHSLTAFFRYLEGYRHGKAGITTRYYSREHLDDGKMSWLSYCSGYMMGQKKLVSWMDKK